MGNALSTVHVSPVPQGSPRGRSRSRGPIRDMTTSRQLIVGPGLNILLGEKRFFRSTGKECTCWAFHRSKHLVWLLFERASRCYESRQPTLDVLSKCFEQRDALGSSDEYSEVVYS